MKIRYLIAQGVILLLWALEWRRVGVSREPQEYLTLPAVILGLVALALPLTILVGLADGYYGRRREGVVRQLILSIVVAGLAAYITAAGIGALNLQHIERPPSADARVGVLIGVEVIFLIEWGMGVGIRRLRSG